MAEEPPSSSSASAPEDLSVNISIVSPSLSVNAPLNFPGLSPSTTIDQLKQKVRDALDSKPTNEQQRLIHQGKLLARETETLLDVFGEQKVSRCSSGCPGMFSNELPGHRFAAQTRWCCTWSSETPSTTTLPLARLPRLKARGLHTPSMIHEYRTSIPSPGCHIITNTTQTKGTNPVLSDRCPQHPRPDGQHQATRPRLFQAREPDYRLSQELKRQPSFSLTNTSF